MAEPDALELQAHAITTAMESAHEIIVEDFWMRSGRAWLKYWAQPDGPMWVVTVEPWSRDGTAEDELERLRAEVERLRAAEATEWGVRFTAPNTGRTKITACADKQAADWDASCLRARGYSVVIVSRQVTPWTEVTEEATDA